MERNDLFILAEKWVNETNSNIFLTGKAGTGKTTFLKHIKETTHKNAVVLAPTGIAAINAGGSTLHSFFRLPFGTFIPTQSAPDDNEKVITASSLPSLIRYTKQHIQLIRTLELLIIDEVSMVRADVLDMIDLILKRVRHAAHLPFGGVQVLFIGDMHQLPPVVKEAEARLLDTYYASPYFFDSQVLKHDAPVMITLEKVYRQQEEKFLSLLNELRHNTLSPESYQLLLQKITSTPPNDDSYITLTSHVAMADKMNELSMQQLSTPSVTFQASIEGDFPEFSYPAATTLSLKVGARVMFIKNDPDKQYFNGKTGKIISIQKEQLHVRCDDGKLVNVSATSWHHVKYATNETTGAIEEVILGKFWQIPLRLAWAVTIHKSQGLTFDKVIIDAEKSFASGQVYVALSRCKTWEGIVLLSKIKPESLMTDLKIVAFSEMSWQQEQLEKCLPAQQHSFQAEKILESFDLSAWKKHASALQRAALEFEHSLSNETKDYLRQLANDLLQLHDVAYKFNHQLQQLVNKQVAPEENTALQIRIKEASVYFSKTNKGAVVASLESLPDAPDNALYAKQLLAQLEVIRESSLLHQSLWEVFAGGFSTSNYQATKAKTLQELSKLKPLKWGKSTTQKNAVAEVGSHQSLLQDLKTWRAETAAALGVEPYRILSNKAIDGIVAQLPLNKKALMTVHGIGAKKTKDYGAKLLEIIGAYQTLLPELDFEEQPNKKTKEKGISGTYQDTLVLYQSGMDMAAIATARNLTKGTIGSHFYKLILEKAIFLRDVLSETKEQAIRTVLEEVVEEMNYLSLAKEQLGDAYEYHEIKWVLAQLQLEKEA